MAKNSFEHRYNMVASHRKGKSIITQDEVLWIIFFRAQRSEQIFFALAKKSLQGSWP